MRDIHLRSGKWRWSLEGAGGERQPRLELINPALPDNKMLVPAPDAPAVDQLEADAVAEAARDPDVRLWTDEYGILWRIAHVGPETHYPYAFEVPHLVFDSEQSFSGIVEIDPYARLGDLQDDELRLYRDRMKDFGGRRRGFRPPATTTH